jgi:mannose-6-phosphate isomerase-like protein (cupin superfamily)
MAKLEVKNVGSPDETRKFEHGKLDLVNVGDGAVGLTTFQPGWKWSNDVKPIARTELCEAPHFIYQISGRMHVVMKDGSTHEFGPGDVGLIPPGHDAWVLGNEPAVAIDWSGAKNYAKG